MGTYTPFSMSWRQTCRPPPRQYGGTEFTERKIHNFEKKTKSLSEMARRKCYPKFETAFRKRRSVSPNAFKKLAECSPTWLAECFRNGSPNALCQGTSIILFRTGPSQHDGGRYTSGGINGYA
jgi:hypothetical protein